MVPHPAATAEGLHRQHPSWLGLTAAHRWQTAAGGTGRNTNHVKTLDFFRPSYAARLQHPFLPWPGQFHKCCVDTSVVLNRMRVEGTSRSGTCPVVHVATSICLRAAGATSVRELPANVMVVGRGACPDQLLTFSCCHPELEEFTRSMDIQRDM